MPRYSHADNIGSKLAPKLVDLISQSVITTKQGLTGHEHMLRTGVIQHVINEMGHEAAAHFAPFAPLVLGQDNLHPAMRTFMEGAFSGQKQWEAAGQFIFQSSGIAGALGTAINNAVAPIVYALNRTGPNIVLDPETAAAATVRNLISANLGLQFGADQGVQHSLMEVLFQLAQTMMDVPTIFQLMNRGVLDTGTARYYLGRSGYTDEVQNLMLHLRESILSPADAALAVLRGNIDAKSGETIAVQNGLSLSSFNILLGNTGEPPGAQELMEGLRRGFIDAPTFAKGIRQSRVRDEWVGFLQKLRYSPMSTADAVQAFVQGYITSAKLESLADQNGLEPGSVQILADAAGSPLSRTEMAELVRRGEATVAQYESAMRQSRVKNSYIPLSTKLIFGPPTVADAIDALVQGHMTEATAKDVAKQNGLDAQFFDALVATAGEPLSKTEMLQLLRRGVASKAQVEQALRESRLKDSYIPLALELSTHIPELFEIRTLLADGTFTAQQGMRLLLQDGYSEDVAAAIVKGATGAKTNAVKTLTEAMYAALYEESAITGDELIAELKDLGYTEASAELIKTLLDNKIGLANRNSVISKVRAAYTGHRITSAQAQHSLNELGIASGMVEKLIDDWNIIIESDVKLLTAAEVIDAWFMQLFSPGNQPDNTQQALSYLKNIGYSAGDALMLLQIKNKGPLDGTDGSTQAQPVRSKKSTSGPASGNG